MLSTPQINTDWRQSQLPRLAHGFLSLLTCRTDPMALHWWRRPSLMPHVTVSIRSPTVSNCPERSGMEDAFLPSSGVLLLSPALSDVMDSLPAHHTHITALVSRAAGLRIPAKSLNYGATTTPEA